MSSFKGIKHLLISCLLFLNCYRPKPRNKKRTTPESIGSYDLGKELGSGTYGTVYVCTHRRNKKRYAGKLFNIDFASDPANMDMIYSEVDILKKLSHKNTVSFVDLVFSPHGVLLVMELVQGKDLYDMLIDTGRMVEPFARILFVQLMEAIKYLHGQRIVHRDINIVNTLVDNRGTLKVVDYGFAEQIPEDVYEKEGLSVYGAAGTKICSPPEIIEIVGTRAQSSAKLKGDKADIWSAGVFLYCLVAGTFPFPSEPDEELSQNILDVKIHYDPLDFSPELEDLLRSILKLQPAERVSVEEIMSHPWVQDKPLHDSSNTVFNSLSGKLQVEFTSGPPKKITSCPSTSLKPSSLPDLTSKNKLSCEELSGWRSEGSIGSTSETDTQSDNTTGTNNKKARRLRFPGIMRKAYSKLKSMFQKQPK